MIGSMASSQMSALCTRLHLEVTTIWYHKDNLSLPPQLLMLCTNQMSTNLVGWMDISSMLESGEEDFKDFETNMNKNRKLLLNHNNTCKKA